MAGRPTAYKEEMLELAVNYITGGYKELQHAIPSVVGLAIHLGVAKSTLYKWCEDKDHPFSDILEFSNDSQEFALINGSLNNNLNPTISKLMLTKHGYSDKQDMGLSGSVDGTVTYVSMIKRFDGTTDKDDAES